MDFSTLAPVRGTGLTRRSSGREAGPNPFLDNGWLKESYDLHMTNGSPEGADFEVTVPGSWVSAVKLRGKNKGAAYEKLTGDAASVVRMLRDAADKLEIGVAIECVPAIRVVNAGKRNERVEEIDGMVTVKYLGKERKVYAAREDTDTNGEAPDADEDEGPDIGEEDSE